MNKNSEVVCGGTVDKSYEAPKKIKSKDLTAIYTEFFYTQKYGSRENVPLRIKLKRNEKNELILSEDGHYEVSIKVGDEVLKGIQEIIDSFGLSEFNGIDRYTSGLPEPYSPIYFKADYASGENIYFCMNGDSDIPWCQELGEYFLKICEEYGETSVLPPKESTQITGFQIRYFDGVVEQAYGSALGQDDTEQLYREKYDYKANKSLQEDFIAVPENFYTELESLLKDLKVYTLTNGYSEDEAKTTGTKEYFINITHADLFQEYGSLKGEKITPETLEKLQKIIRFVESYFGEK